MIFLLPEPSYVYLVISNPIVEEKGGRRGDRNNSEPFPMALSSKEATHFLADTKKDEMAALREEVAALWEEVVFLGKAGSTSKEELTATKEEMATLKRADDTSKAELAAMREEMGLMKVALTEELRSVNVLADRVEEMEKCLMKEGRVSKSHHASSDAKASSVEDIEGSGKIKAMSGKRFEEKTEDLVADPKPQHVSHEVSMDVNNNMEHIGDENGKVVAQEDKVSDIVSSYPLEHKKKVDKAQEIGEENLDQDQVDLDFVSVKPKMKVKKSREGTKEISKSDVDTSVGIPKVVAESVVSDQVAPVVPDSVSAKPKKKAEKSHEGTKEEESTALKQDTENMGNNSTVPNFVSVKPKKKAERSLGGTKEEESTDVEAASKHVTNNNVGNSSVIQDFVSLKPKKKVETSLEDAKEVKNNDAGESVAASKLDVDNNASDSVVQDFVSLKPKMVKKVKK